MAKSSSGRATASNLHDLVQLRRCHPTIEKTELASVGHLPCSIKQTGHCCTKQRSRQADAPDANSGEVTYGERFSFDSHHKIERLRHSRTNCTHCSKVGQSRGE